MRRATILPWGLTRVRLLTAQRTTDQAPPHPHPQHWDATAPTMPGYSRCRGHPNRQRLPGGEWELKHSGLPLWRFDQNSRKETMSVLCAVPRRLAGLSPQKPLMSWTWNVGREEGRRGFGEGDASHLFPRPKVPR